MEADMIGIVFDTNTCLKVASYNVIKSVLLNRSNTFELRKAEHDLLERTYMRIIIVEMNDWNKED